MSELGIIVVALVLTACIGSKVTLEVGNRSGTGHTVERSWDIGSHPEPTPDCTEPDCK